MNPPKKFADLSFNPFNYSQPAELNLFYLTAFEKLLQQVATNELDVVQPSDLATIEYNQNQCFLCPKVNQLKKGGLRAWIHKMKFQVYQEESFNGKIINLQDFSFQIGKKKSKPNLYIRIVKYRGELKRDNEIYNKYYLVHVYQVGLPKSEENNQQQQQQPLQQQQQANNNLPSDQDILNPNQQNAESNDNSEEDQYLYISSNSDLDEYLPQINIKVEIDQQQFNRQQPVQQNQQVPQNNNAVPSPQQRYKVEEGQQVPSQPLNNQSNQQKYKVEEGSQMDEEEQQQQQQRMGNNSRSNFSSSPINNNNDFYSNRSNQESNNNYNINNNNINNDLYYRQKIQELELKLRQAQTEKEELIYENTTIKSIMRQYEQHNEQLKKSEIDLRNQKEIVQSQLSECQAQILAQTQRRYFSYQQQS